MESVNNAVGCSNCEFCCAYSHLANPYCASQRECNGPHGVSIGLAVALPIVCLIAFTALLIVCYKLGKDRVFDVFNQDQQIHKKQLEKGTDVKNNDQITESNIEDTQAIPYSQRKFDSKVK